MQSETYDPREKNGDVFPYDSEAQFLAASIATPILSVETKGFYGPGDGGGHTKKRISAPSPVRPWHKQSADGAWWELVATDSITPLHFGAIPTAGTDCSAAFAAMVGYARFFGVKMKLPGGGRVYDKAGTTLIYDNMTLDIEAGATLRRTGSNSYVFTNTDGTRPGGYNGCKNFTLCGFGTIDLNSTGPTTTAVLVFAHQSGLVWRDNSVTGGYQGHYFECNSSENVLVENVKFLDKAYAPGTDLYETIQIDHSNATGYPSNGPYDNTPCRNITIRGCYFHGPAHSAVGSHSNPPGVLHENIVVADNFIIDQGVYSIRAQSWRNSRIEGNIIISSGKRGILVYDCQDLIIERNTVSGGCADDGTRIGFGIAIGTQEGVTPRNVVIRGNNILNVLSVGISPVNGTDHEVSDNYVLDAGREAIRQDDGSSRVSINDNRIVGGSTIGNGLYSAILIEGTACSVRRNRIYRSAAANTYSNGIYFASASLRNRCDNNDVQAGITAAIGEQTPATSLNSINGRTLLFSGNVTSGNISLADAVTNYEALEVQTGGVAAGTFSSGRATPFQRAWNTGFTDHVTVKTISGKVDCTITNATNVAIVTANDPVRQIYGLAM